jgi:hypothetical protein
MQDLAKVFACEIWEGPEHWKQVVDARAVWVEIGGDHGLTLVTYCSPWIARSCR